MKRFVIEVVFDLKHESVIHNPTGIDVEIEDNRIVVEHETDLVATGKLSPVRIPAGETVRHRAALTVAVSPLELRKGRALFEARQWRVVLYLMVADDLELPVYLLTPP